MQLIQDKHPCAPARTHVVDLSLRVSGSVPPRRCETTLVRQLNAMDAWNAFRRQREQFFAGSHLSRDDRMLARIELESMRCTHAAVLGRAAQALAMSGQPTTWATPSPTVVIAHRSRWFADRIRRYLETNGARVLECTDNGAIALGVIIAEQPDCVLVSDRLVMVSGEQLLTQTARYAPLTKHVVHAEHSPDLPFQRAGTQVLGPGHRPEAVADAVRWLP